jgi:hypothetical protein
VHARAHGLHRGDVCLAGDPRTFAHERELGLALSQAHLREERAGVDERGGPQPRLATDPHAIEQTVQARQRVRPGRAREREVERVHVLEQA